jgi:lipopolysaccharide export system protein LptC
MVKAIYTRMDEQGLLASQIYTSKMTHYPHDDVSKFTDPRIIIFTQDRQPWNVTAEQGVSQHGITQVTLQNNVNVHQNAGPNNQELTLTTSSLTIFPETQTAYTNQPVTIIQPGTVINSVGLHADLKKGVVELLSKASGVYETTISQ